MLSKIRLMGNFFQIKLKRRIDQLKTYSKYAVVVQAFNRVGAGPKSSPVLVMTSEDGM